MDKSFLFPYHTLLSGKISDVPARVNRFHGLSFHMLPHMRGIDLRLPAIMDIIYSRIQIQNIAGTFHYPSGLIKSNPSRAGLLLSTMMKLFEGDWNIVRQRVLDKFWLEALTGNGNYKEVEMKWDLGASYGREKKGKQVIDSRLGKGDGLFCLKDLYQELECIYHEYAGDIHPLYKHHVDDFQVAGMNDWVKERYQEDQQNILHSLNYFVKCEALFIGIKVACGNCGSNLWYSLQELSHRMICRGCTTGVVPKAESVYYYKVNDTILNNLMSDPVKRLKAYGGNYLVLKVLDFLRDPVVNKNSPSFGYCPSLDIFLQGETFSKTDLDIIALQDGKLIVGEAKMNANDFNKQQIDQLIWIGNEIRPDVLLLAYQDGKLKETVLEKIRLGLKTPNVSVKELKTKLTSFQFGVMKCLSAKTETIKKPRDSVEKQAKIDPISLKTIQLLIP